MNPKNTKIPQKIKIVTFRVGKAPAVEEIEDTLAAMQEFVGGFVQAVPIRVKVEGELAPRLSLYCNEDGRALALPVNRFVHQLESEIRGDFFVVAPPLAGPQQGRLRSLSEMEQRAVLRWSVLGTRASS